jgi:hypothetical protein
MFVDRSVPRISREFERFRFAREIKQSILDEIQGCIVSGDLPANLEPAAAMRALGAGLLGVAVTRVSDRLAPGEDPDKMAANILDLTLAGLRAGISLQPITTSACPLDDAVAAEGDAVSVEEHR